MSTRDKQAKGILVCCCKEANKNCYLTCAKGRKIKPAKMYVTSWPKGRSV